LKGELHEEDKFYVKFLWSGCTMDTSSYFMRATQDILIV